MDDPDGYRSCWIMHCNRNPHHWEFWVARPKSSTLAFPQFRFKAAPIPMKYVREMVADWMGACRTYDGFWPDVSNWEFVNKHYPDMILHDTTKERIEIVMNELRKKQ